MEDFDWIFHPFSLLSTFLLLRARGELTDFKADRTLKLKFLSSRSTHFVEDENSVISEMAVKILLPFSTMYLSALDCSAPTEIKTSDLQRISATEEEMIN